ncbi:MAG: CoA pyrophosphatase [Granulosicoccus sp.]|nr:CoA pyrophosphatase [Granulosicoccus sp.]
MQCDNNLLQQIRQRLSSFAVIRQTAEKSAAVALIVTHAGNGPDLSDFHQTNNWSEEPALLLTRRSSSLKRHAGQWALPGGRVDAGESIFEAAIRETREEIGLELDESHLLGQLDDYITRSGYVMTPLVFWAPDTSSMQANPDEVASIHRIPAAELLRDDAPILDFNELADESETEKTGTLTTPGPVLRMPIGKAWIAAPTAALLYQFREVCLLDKQTRVAHFEQPRFAWK